MAFLDTPKQLDEAQSDIARSLFSKVHEVWVRLESQARQLNTSERIVARAVGFPEVTDWLKSKQELQDDESLRKTVFNTLYGGGENEVVGILIVGSYGAEDTYGRSLKICSRAAQKLASLDKGGRFRFAVAPHPGPYPTGREEAVFAQNSNIRVLPNPPPFRTSLAVGVSKIALSWNSTCGVLGLLSMGKPHIFVGDCSRGRDALAAAGILSEAKNEEELVEVILNCDKKGWTTDFEEGNFTTISEKIMEERILLS